MNDIARAMPRYKSHKSVRALEIADVTGWQLTFKDEGHPPRVVQPTLFARYTPIAGDFLVQYEDGYLSISPRQAFVDGYTAEAQHDGLPVAGYKPQNTAAVDAVNVNKALEEQCLRQIEALNANGNPLNADPRWLAIGRTQIEQAFMAINRAVFKPGRVKLPSDAASPAA
jgi:hypothetical protein